ncbi:hypothetical protein STN0717CIT72_42770 [Citrobacter portucalensis]|nr:hypothetical protein STN0717CIT72_42770 [Citrobacter portucalensis]
MTCLLRYYPTRLLFAFISITFCFISRVHQVLCREDIVQFRLGQQTALQDNFTYALTGFGTNFTDDVAVVVTNERVEARIQIISATVMDWRRGEASC